MLTELMGKRARWWLIGAAALLFLSVAARFVSRRFVFPTHEVARSESPSGFVEHVLAAEDGVLVHALELPSPPGGRTVVYFHNNRETAESRASLARELHARGVGVLLVEYRGYGRSAGDPSEDGLYRDAEAALDMLARRGVGAQRIVLWGTSLGTGVAAEMARRGRGASLVLETPYTSIPDLVRDAVPLVPASLLIADHFDTLSKAREIRVPTLVIHGDADEIVPFWMGEHIVQNLPHARMVRIPAGRHGDLFARQRERLLDAIASLGA